MVVVRTIGEGTNLNATTKCANQTGCNGRVLDSGKNRMIDSTALRHHGIHVCSGTRWPDPRAGAAQGTCLIRSKGYVSTNTTPDPVSRCPSGRIGSLLAVNWVIAYALCSIGSMRLTSSLSRCPFCVVLRSRAALVSEQQSAGGRQPRADSPLGPLVLWPGRGGLGVAAVVGGTAWYLI